MLLVPLLMSKLDTSTDADRSTREDIRTDRLEEKEFRLNDLHPAMSNSLGNYEPRDLPAQSGPGEGGKISIDCHDG